MENLKERLSKDIKKNRRDSFILIGMAIVGFAVCVLLFFSFGNVEKKVNIAKYGKIATATVTHVWDRSDDDEDEYQIEYTYKYLDRYGKERTGTGKFTTSSGMWRNGDTLKIKHNGNNEEVLLNYPTSFFLAAIPQVIAIIVFAIVSVFMVVGVFATSIKASRLKQLAAGKGEEIQASIIGEEYRNNGTNTCKLKYMWETPNGKVKEGKTRETFTSEEAELVKQKGSIRVLYYKGESIVLDVFNQTQEQKTERLLARNGASKCPYCGTIMKASDRECPSCGAKR